MYMFENPSLRVRGQGGILALAKSIPLGRLSVREGETTTEESGRHRRAARKARRRPPWAVHQGVQEVPRGDDIMAVLLGTGKVLASPAQCSLSVICIYIFGN